MLGSLPAPAPSPHQRRLLLALSVCTFMVGLDGRIVAPLLPSMARDFHTSLAVASYSVSFYLLPYGLCQLGYGPLADRFGKIRVAAYAMLAFSAGTAACGAFARLTGLLLLRAVTGAAAAALIPLTIAHIGDTVPYSQRQATLGLLMASSGAAQSLSTSAGGLLATWMSWRSISTLQARATEAFPQARGRALALFAFSLFVGGGAGTFLQLPSRPGIA
jgi:predicted MFS family arabinose efflux permease